ncbi:MAG: DeoR/GlpR transcriptional regulator [Sphingomonadales bacterium]|nr:DeoR/GlpR transcriptional regulator [Sphingomonadales bacterium]
MHANERETMILGLVAERDFVSFSELERVMAASAATIRRDLTRLAQEGHILRVRGGVKTTQPLPNDTAANLIGTRRLLGVPFQENQQLHRTEKEAIGKAAAKLCVAGEAVMIDGGSTTLQMCPHIASLGLQVLTNSLHIVAGLIDQPDTRILVPSGAVFAEQNIILSAFGDDGMPRFHAPKLFMGAASIGPLGIMQLDIILVASERRFIDRADEIIVLVDSSKFSAPSGHVVCELERIDTIVTDNGITDDTRKMLEAAGVKVVIAA